MGKRESIEFGCNNLLDADEFDKKHTKVMITTRLDGEVLEAVKIEAASRGIKYQTLINQFLRERLIGTAEDEKIRRIVRDELQHCM